MYSKTLTILLFFYSINLLAQHQIKVGKETSTYLSVGNNEFQATENNTSEISENRALNLFFNEQEYAYSNTRIYGILEGKELVLPMIFNLKDNEYKPSSRLSTGGAIGVFDFQKKKWTIPLFNGELSKISENAYVVSKGGYRGLLSKDNEVLLDLKYGIIQKVEGLDNYVMTFSRELSQIGIYNIVAKKFTFQGDYASIDKIEGRNYFMVRNFKGEFNICDINGNLKLENWCSEIKKNDKSPNLYIVKKDNHYGVVNINGKVEIPIELKKLNSISYSKDGSYLAQNKSGKYGLIRLNGTVTLPIEYDKIDRRAWPIENTNDRMLIGKKAGKFGTISVGTGAPKPLIPCEYDNIIYSKKMLVAEKKGKFGLIDFYGTAKTDFIYDAIVTTQSGFLIGKIKKKQYLINPENQIDTPNPFDEVADIDADYINSSRSPKNLFKVRKKEKYAVLSETNEVLSPFSFDAIIQRRNATVVVQNNGKQGLYDLKTKSLIAPCEYDFINLNSWKRYAIKGDKVFAITVEDQVILEEMNVNKSGEKIDYYDKSRYEISKAGENLEYVKVKGNSKNYGVLKNGKLILPIAFEKKRSSDAGHIILKLDKIHSLFNLETQKWMLPAYTELKSIGGKAGFYIAKKGKNYGLIDKDNNVLLDFEWQKIETIYRLKGHLKLTKWVDSEKGIGIYNLDEKRIITQSLYSELSVADEQKIKVTDKSGKNNTIDKNGNLLLKNWYTSLKPVSQSDIFIAQIDDKVALLDKEEQNLTPFSYTSIKNVSGQNGCFLAQNLSGKYVFFDKNGTSLFPLQFDLVKKFDYYIHLTKNGDKYGLLKIEKDVVSEILPCEYDKIDFIRGNYCFKKDGKYGLLRRDYTTTKELIYDELKPISSDLFVGKINEKSFLLSLNKIPVKQVSYATLEPLFENYDRLSPFSYLKFSLSDNGKMGILDSNGDVIVQPKFEDVISANEDILVVKNQGKIGLFNVSSNRNILPFEYDSIVATTNGFYAVKGKEHYLITTEGELVFNRL